MSAAALIPSAELEPPASEPSAKTPPLSKRTARGASVAGSCADPTSAPAALPAVTHEDLPGASAPSSVAVPSTASRNAMWLRTPYVPATLPAESIARASPVWMTRPQTFSSRPGGVTSCRRPFAVATASVYGGASPPGTS